MNASDDYCELCDLPRSQCIHGQPPPPVPPKATPAPRSRPATRTTTRSTTSTTARTTTKAAPPRTLRWTPPEVFKPLILTVLEEAGGELEADEVYQQLATVAGDQLRTADHETTPEGELRWQYAARRARVALIKEGRMTKGRPGVWQLA